MGENNPLVIHDILFFPFIRDFRTSKLKFQGIFLNDLKEPGPEVIMHFHTNANDPGSFFFVNQIHSKNSHECMNKNGLFCFSYSCIRG